MAQDDELSTILSEDNVYSSSEEINNDPVEVMTPSAKTNARTKRRTIVSHAPILRTAARSTERNAKLVLKASPPIAPPNSYSLDRNPFMYTGVRRLHRPVDVGYTALGQGWRASKIDDEMDILPAVAGMKIVLYRSQSADDSGKSPIFLFNGDRMKSNLRQSSAIARSKYPRHPVNKNLCHTDSLPPASPSERVWQKNVSQSKYPVSVDQNSNYAQSTAATRARSARPRSGYGNRRARRNIDGTIVCA